MDLLGAFHHLDGGHAMNSAIHIHQVGYRYGAANAYATGTHLSALENINLDIKPGECILLCGPSGGGKSSLLRLINGLIPHFHEGEMVGEVRVCGQNTKESSLAKLGESTFTVFQNPRTQFFTGHVLSELAFALENRCVPPDQIRRQVAKALTELSITDLQNRALNQLSGGQLQKVACAGALTAHAQVLLFDEPTANLDPQATASWRQTLQKLRDKGLTMVFAEHRLYYLKGLIDRALVVQGGKVVADLSASQLWSLDETQRQKFGLRGFTEPKLPQPPIPIGNGSAPKTRRQVTNGLELEGVQFSYRTSHGRKKVLDIPYLAFPAGQISAVVGDNGAGKTTLLRLLCGLEKPQAGQILLKGKRLSAKEATESAFLVSQDVNRQLFTASVAEEVVLGLSKPELPSKSQIVELARQYDLEKCLDRHPLSLSGGEKQRVVIAAAPAAKTQVYLFDEPSSGVDRRHLETIGRTMKDLAESGAVVVVVTHDYELLKECDGQVYHLESLPAS